jgi:hypothetical protein
MFIGNKAGKRKQRRRWRICHKAARS